MNLMYDNNKLLIVIMIQWVYSQTLFLYIKVPDIVKLFYLHQRKIFRTCMKKQEQH